jgi:hypothetical protein
MSSKREIFRREFIKGTALATGYSLIPKLSLGLSLPENPIGDISESQPSNNEGIKTVAFIANTYWNQSHADMVATKIFLGYPMDEGLVKSKLKIVSVWIDQIKFNDTGVRIATMNGAKIYPTISEALTLGGDQLAVDAVIYIGEHGDYPLNRLGQKLYPRMNFLEQIFRVFDASKRSVPLYTDKHLAYSWLDSKWIYDRGKELNVPMMAGSSIPYTWRKPFLQHPIGTKITEAVAFTYAKLDIYAIHVMELLQSMLERRSGGETGISSLETIEGNAVWDALDSGRISWDLLNAAYDTITYKLPGTLRELIKDPVAVILNYIDGTKASFFILNGFKFEKMPNGIRNNGHFAYAAMADGKKVASEFVVDASLSHSHFSYLTYNIEKFILSGTPPASIERNLLCSGVADMAVRSQIERRPIDTPFLKIKYSAEGQEPFLPKNPGPVGQSLGPWPPKGYEFINFTH